MRTRTAAVIILALLAGACSEPATSPRTVRADFMNNPDVGNGVVYRSGTEFAICWTDFSNGLRACQRTQQFPGGECGVFDPIGGVSDQEVFAVVDPVNFFESEVKANVMGKMWITVRDLNHPGNCYGAARVAEGWGSLHYTDNDEFGADPTDPSVDAWGYMAHGVLTTSSGGTVMYDGHARYSFSGTAGFHAFQQVVNVH